MRAFQISPNMSQADINAAQNEISQLQTTMWEELSSLIQNAFLSYNAMSRYEESWDFEMNIKMDIADFFMYNFNLKLEDYTSHVQSLDQSFQGDVMVDFEMDSSYGDSLSADASSDASLIVKDGIYYLKLKDTVVNLSEAAPEMLSSLVERLNDLGKTDTYIQFEDANTQQLFKVIENLVQSSPEELIKSISSENLFEAYDTTQTGYLLRPTKEMCNALKQSSGLLFWFYNNECSESQYNDMLSEMRNSGLKLHMELGNINTLTLSIENYNTDWEISMRYTDYGLVSIEWYIIEPGNADINNINFSYVPKESLSLIMNIEEVLESDLAMTFRNDNSLKTVNYYGKISDNQEEIVILWEYAASAIKFEMSWALAWVEIDCLVEWNMRKTHWDTQWECNIIETNSWSDEKEVYGFNADLDYDFRDRKNNLHFDMQMNQNNENTFELTVSNVGEKKGLSKHDIRIPKNIITSEEFDEISGMNLLNTNSFFSWWEIDYTVETNQYDDYSETCYMYASWDSTCYEYHDNKSVTCTYTAETDTETCDEYSYGYQIEKAEFSDYSQTCYIYDSWDSICYNYYDAYTQSCYDYSANNWDVYCNEQHDTYYYNGLNDVYYYDTYEVDWKTWERTDYNY